MDPNNYATVEAFVKSMEKVAEIVRERKPDCILAPMFGAVSFIDVLNIIDEQFPNEKVEYVPASNRVYRVREVLRGVFENLIGARVPNGGSFLSIDEVVSGNSLTRVFKQFEAAKTNYANKKTIETYGQGTDFRTPAVQAFRDGVQKKIDYKSVGVVDSKGKGKENPEYLDLLRNGTVIPVDTPCIVTMDRTDYFTAQYQLARDGQGADVFLPVVDRFNVSSAYMDFLMKVAGMVGKDPAGVNLHNFGKIRASYNLVPEALRKV